MISSVGMIGEDKDIHNILAGLCVCVCVCRFPDLPPAVAVILFIILLFLDYFCIFMAPNNDNLNIFTRLYLLVVKGKKYVIDYCYIVASIRYFDSIHNVNYGGVLHQVYFTIGTELLFGASNVKYWHHFFVAASKRDCYWSYLEGLEDFASV